MKVSLNGVIAEVDAALAKYDPDQPRDDHGRWTGGDGTSGDPKLTPPPARHHQADARHVVQTGHRGVHRPAGERTSAKPKLAPQPKQRRQIDAPTTIPTRHRANLIPVSAPIGANDNFPGSSAYACNVASRFCEVHAMNDKQPYFMACREAEAMCLLTLQSSIVDPIQPFIFRFPDGTKLLIENGRAVITHVGGAQLIRPLTPR